MKKNITIIVNLFFFALMPLVEAGACKISELQKKALDNNDTYMLQFIKSAKNSLSLTDEGLSGKFKRAIVVSSSDAYLIFLRESHDKNSRSRYTADIKMYVWTPDKKGVEHFQLHKKLTKKIEIDFFQKMNIEALLTIDKSLKDGDSLVDGQSFYFDEVTPDSSKGVYFRFSSNFIKFKKFSSDTTFKNYVSLAQDLHKK